MQRLVNKEKTMSMSKFATAEDYYKAEAERNRKDAERYRWLRAQREWHEMNQTQDAMWRCDMPAREVDSAIDAAIAAEKAVGAA